AVKFLLIALEKDPENAVIMGVLGASFDELDEKEKSAEYYEKALKIQPDNAILLNNYGYSLSVHGERLEEALEMVSRALEADPENGSFLDTIGWVYYKLGNYDKALEYIKKSVAIRNSSAEVLEHLGDVYEKLGQMELAVENWQKAKALDPDRESLTTRLQDN
ncbi:tetratricopeptide repeat protein, partial [candidate division KSB1 bacterium]|nr:tetratricopeptide repeat protein [candidate division KSB1 bacterium]